MVSGFVTSPDDQSRICFDEARPMRIASKSLMSIKVTPFQAPRSQTEVWHRKKPVRWRSELRSFLQLHFFCERARLVLGLLSGFLGRRERRVCDVDERLVVRKRQLAVLVDALLALLDLLGVRLACGGP